MTTPAERRRNLIWGREALEELAQDDTLPADWRAEAASLFSDYPALERLQGVDDVDLAQVQEEFIEVLSAAKWLFMRVQRHEGSTEQRKYSLMVVLRHFL